MRRDIEDPLQASVQYLKGVGPRRAEDLATAGLRTVEDLLLALPRRYEDRARLTPIDSLKPTDVTAVTGKILSCGVRSTRRPGFRIVELVIQDDSGTVRATFLNQSFLKEVFAPRRQVVLFGKVERRRAGGLQFTNPDYEVLPVDDDGDEALMHTGRIVPVYEKLGGLTPKLRRRVVYGALQRLPEEIIDPLPDEVRHRLTLPTRAVALRDAHFPPPDCAVEMLDAFRTPAQRRLVFEEFFFFQLGLALRRREAATRMKPRTIRVDDRIRRAALAVLPFRLTTGQRQALKDIVGDLQRPHPMNRLLQGDVGSGKTIVALLAALVAMESGVQVAVMSPTEILAEQHYLNLTRLLAPSRFDAVLLTGTMPAAARRVASGRMESGASQLVVGTHALVQQAVRFKTLGLVIIDEQHRFGVMQRATLRSKGLASDVLVMTATPIPRTLALTVYGDLDSSEIRELPPGRRAVRTTVRPDALRAENYALIEREIARGRQAYVVCPSVEESTRSDLTAATDMAEHLRSDVFPARRVALVHGRMKNAERDRIMRDFAAGSIDVLVATTVIEVGIDVANATVMVVEHAERFGLAQLHQLRGRVGRGPAQAHCVLTYHPPLSDLARARLDALAATDDGFEVAERDLELRGPGDFFGTRQSGLPVFRVGDVMRDHQVMDDARRAAFAWLDGREFADGDLQAVRDVWAARYGLVRVG